MYAPVCFTAQANFTRKADRLHIPAVLPLVFQKSVRHNSDFGRGSVDISRSECPRCCVILSLIVQYLCFNTDSQLLLSAKRL